MPFLGKFSVRFSNFLFTGCSFDPQYLIVVPFLTLLRQLFCFRYALLCSLIVRVCVQDSLIVSYGCKNEWQIVINGVLRCEQGLTVVIFFIF